jgi:hydrogenase nickel incorporation protein HypA/HybF
MHEVYIAESLLELAIDRCRQSGFNSIKSIKIRVGKASVVSTEALIFAFNVLKIGSIADNASLIIEEVPTIATCKDCKMEFSVKRDFVFQCPFCKSEKIVVNSGNGVLMDELEVDE